MRPTTLTSLGRFVLRYSISVPKCNKEPIPLIDQEPRFVLKSLSALPL
jgi:hypothetical protein